ncbi:hypothetical protein ASG56_13840 [Rhodococcus sp. Leaf7]|uniref:DUF6764 family protein n=1 Tax=unclassified Rhodococcus (in: high G+C Gram-positive bacteria) TaxID=192944 RepID=UPI0006F69F62|nr:MULTISPECIES: DUF6764 family protein [unclassified Rhodococcus (in: high G+C Gram-positive bacteria)]KQU04424.1 hypothetical protein ASG56_13840 [Rhodococcus sp. Leaf7]KQU40609.1 hypothetical protein ASG64_13830 [Rhodococcus sp. Leaf247]
MSVVKKTIAGAFGIALGVAAFLPATASAAPVTACQAPFGADAVPADGLCEATSDASSAAAAYGNASADASRNALALALGLNGGTASSSAVGFAAPAAIAFGPGSVADALGLNPGLSIAIAGPGSTVTVDSLGGVTCDGPGFAGDLTTLKACLRVN